MDAKGFKYKRKLEWAIPINIRTPPVEEGGLF
jgi:hypothetical protein